MNLRYRLNSLRTKLRRDHCARQIERENREREERSGEIENDSNQVLGLHQGVQR